ncbi:putative LEU2 [Lyophyllum shimeji]|uniref:3-isopropylmalate dehydrogenase n=1 Tax=Lyophyllum shimeji TaxID=47721 RepID=A0A9P3PEK2_LYOSH|nr:putative LEU2 [Lyophyllum shimeji]
MAPRSFRIVVLAGDGIGPEVVDQAVRVLEAVSEAATDYKLNLEPHAFGGCAIDLHGDPLPPWTLKACQEADAILMGSIGGPKWGINAPIRPEPGLLKLRKSLGLYANIRPANILSDSLLDYSPLRPDVARGTDIIVVRELIGGVYFGTRKEQGVDPDPDTAWDTMLYSVEEVQRITHVAAKIAMTKTPPHEIHSVDKANVLASSRLWRKVVTETLTKEYPEITFHHQLVDSASMFITSNPKKVNGIILTENLFGDILSDQASVIPGSLGLLPSASLAGAPSTLSPNSDFRTTPGIYEPIHGSAPDIAGQGIANPIGAILSAALLLRYSLDLEKPAAAIELAVRKALDSPELGGLGLRTRDLGGEVTTEQMGDNIVEILKGLL